MTSAAWRKLIAAVLVIAFGLGAIFSIRWIWRDITYWSRSVTVAYKTDTLGDCVRTAIADWPEVSATSADGVITLVVPGQEGALVKDTPEPQVARIVVSASGLVVTTYCFFINTMVNINSVQQPISYYRIFRRRIRGLY